MITGTNNHEDEVRDRTGSNFKAYMRFNQESIHEKDEEDDRTLD